MISRIFLHLLVISLLALNTLSQNGPDNLDEGLELGDEEDFLTEINDDQSHSSTSKPDNEVKPKKSYFSDDRFVKLFQSRRDRPRPSPLAPRFASKPKPTLPSFIKRSPPLIKAQPQLIAKPDNVIAHRATTAAPNKVSTTATKTPAKSSFSRDRDSNRNKAAVRPQPTPNPSSVSSTTEAQARRRFGSNQAPRQRNSTSILKSKRT